MGEVAVQTVAERSEANKPKAFASLRVSAWPGGVVSLSKVESLASRFCTPEEIAAEMGLRGKAILRRRAFRDAVERGRLKGRVELRNLQWALAEDAKNAGNATILIWLGKVYLGQTDKAASEDGVPEELRLRIVRAEEAEHRSNGNDNGPHAETQRR